jgi:hypothetical protein
VSNGLHSESPLQTCKQCNGQCKSPLPVLTGGTQDLAYSSRCRRRGLKARVSFSRDTADTCGNRCISSSRQRRLTFTARISDVDFIVTGSVFMPVTKVPYGPKETAISHDRWLVVVTVFVWCPLRILDVLTRTWNRRISFRLDRGDAGTQQVSPYWATVTALFWCPLPKFPVRPEKQSFHVIGG